MGKGENAGYHYGKRRKCWLPLREKEKMLVTSIFSFSLNVYYPVKENCAIRAIPILSSAKALNWDKARDLLPGKGFISTNYRFDVTRAPYEGRAFRQGLNSLPHDQLLDWTKLKAFADDKINVAEMMNSLSDKSEDIVEKGENAGFQHFLHFPRCFQKPSFSGTLKVGYMW